MSVVGFHSEKGVRKVNQDRGACIAVNVFQSSSERSLYRAMQIYDGNQEKGHCIAQIANEIGIRNLFSIMADPETDIPDALNKTLQTANHEIFNIQKNLPFEKMSATTGTIAVVKDNELFISYIGDSGLIVFKENKAFSLVKEHTLANQLIDSGGFSKTNISDALHSVLTKAIGVQEQIEASSIRFKLTPPCLLVGGSDGAIRELGTLNIRKILATNISKGIVSAQTLAEAISREAIRQGSDDNSTVAVIVIPQVKQGQFPVHQPYKKNSKALMLSASGRG